LPRRLLAGASCRRCPIFRSPFIASHEAILIIAERLEAEGWPRRSSARRLAEDKVRRCQERVAIVREAAQERVFYPELLRDDIGIVEQHELEEAEKELCRLADQLSQHGSFQEAKKQLREASFHGEITAIGDRYRCSLQTGGRSVQTGKVPSAAFDAMANVDYSTDIIEAPWGDTFRGVRYREADLDRLWPPRAAVANKLSDDAPLVAGAEAPEAPAPDQKPQSSKLLRDDATDAVPPPSVTEEPASPDGSKPRPPADAQLKAFLLREAKRNGGPLGIRAAYKKAQQDPKLAGYGVTEDQIKRLSIELFGERKPGRPRRS
jgi:hypothetical protein